MTKNNEPIAKIENLMADLDLHQRELLGQIKILANGTSIGGDYDISNLDVNAAATALHDKTCNIIDVTEELRNTLQNLDI